MATRIQLRRGTATQWTTANTVLEAGEIGWESNTNKFKIGDGTTEWDDLTYFLDATDTGFNSADYILATARDSVNGVAGVNADINVITKTGVVFEGATANDFETSLLVTDPTADRTLTLPDATDTLVGRATTDTLTNKSISLASNTVTSTLAQLNTAVSDADVASLAGTETLTNKTLTSPKINEDVAVTATSTELNYVDGVTSAIQTQLDGKVDESLFDAKGDLLVGSADNTPAKLTVGTNGYILTANTSAANGIEWAAAPAGYSPPTLGSTQIGSGSTVTTIAGLTLSTPTLSGITVSDGSIVFEGATANDHETTFAITDPTADRTITFPDATGTVALAANVAALSGATFTGAVSGTSLTLSGDLTVNGTTTTINSTTLTVDDINITLGQGNTSDASANGGGITLEGATNKTFNWIDATDAWTSSEHMNLVTGKSYKINGTSITAAIPAGLTWGEVKDGKSGLVIS